MKIGLASDHRGYKLKEALISIFPITMIVVLLNLTPLVAFNTKETIVFIISALFFLSLIFTSFPSFLRKECRLMILKLSCFLTYEFSAIYFFLRTAFASSHQF